MKTIIEMAREAGIYVPEHLQTIATCKTDLGRFADLVRADEREACAKVCEAESAIQKESAKFCKVNTIDQRDFDICAAAIRARGNT